MSADLLFELAPYPEVVEVMRLAGEPYQQLARNADDLQLHGEAEGLRRTAETSSLEAGKAHALAHFLTIDALGVRRTDALDQDVHPFLPEIDPSEKIPAPRLGSHSADVIAKTAVTIAMLTPGQRFVTQIARESGLSRPTIIDAVDELTEAGFLQENTAPLSSDAGRGRRPNLLAPTDTFVQYLIGVPEWRRAYTSRVIAECLGLDEDGATDFLHQLGQAAIEARDKR